MFLTIDGLSGAGKTVQASKIAKRFELKHVSIDMFIDLLRNIEFLATEAHHDNTFTAVLRNLMFIRLMRGQWGNDFVLADNFFRTIGSFWRNRAEMERVLDFFREGLLIERGKEPDASFYLHVDARHRELRRLYRDEKQLNTYKLENVSITTEHNSDDLRSLEFNQWLAERLPYFHIIDGSQPEEKVTADIIGIVEGLYEG